MRAAAFKFFYRFCQSDPETRAGSGAARSARDERVVIVVSGECQPDDKLTHAVTEKHRLPVKIGKPIFRGEHDRMNIVDQNAPPVIFRNIT